jgi:hypothetical protein
LICGGEIVRETKSMRINSADRKRIEVKGMELGAGEEKFPRIPYTSRLFVRPAFFLKRQLIQT